MTTSVLPTYQRAPLAFDHGKGVRLYTEDGKEYLDFGAGVAVTSLGHAHPHLVMALTEQAAKVWHTSNLYVIPGQEKLARRLTDATFADTVFFTNSGAEALECAIKTARRYHFGKGNPERFRIITFSGAFHGRTLATIAAGGQAKYLEGFGPKVEGFDQVSFGDHDALHAAITDETAAILIEPLQGEGGIRSVPPQCLRGLRDLCESLSIPTLPHDPKIGGRFSCLTNVGLLAALVRGLDVEALRKGAHNVIEGLLTVTTPKDFAPAVGAAIAPTRRANTV